MKLNEFNLKELSSVQYEKVSEEDRKIIDKKSGDKAFRICFPVLSVIVLTAIVYSFIVEKEFPLLYILFFVFLCLPMTISSFKKRDKCACYGFAADKTIRFAKTTGRGRMYLPFEMTGEAGPDNSRNTRSENVCEYYYCTVEIDGETYENVCCYRKDFEDINIGDRVVVALEDACNCPVVYGVRAE